MNSSQIFMFLFQSATTVVIGFIAWSVKNTLLGIKESIKENSERIQNNDVKHTNEIAAVKKELGDLRSDLPLIYVLREDYIRCEQNQERKMSSIEDKLDRLLSKG